MAAQSSGLKATEPAPPDHRADFAMVPMRDGVRLATDVYLPDPPGRRVPSVLIRLPYDKNSRYAFLPEIARYLNAAGLAVVTQDVRGRYRSEGVGEPYVDEALDGHDALDWIVAQSWSDGSIAMTGDSYYGFTQWAAASTEHPALKAIVPRVTGSALPNRFHVSNVPRVAFVEWRIRHWATNETFESPVLASSPIGTFANLPEVFEEARRHVLDAADPRRAGELFERAFPSGPPAPRLKIPALHMGGWFDVLQKVQMDDWRDASAVSPAAAHQYLRMNVTDHEDYLLSEDGRRPIDHEVDDEALRAYLPRLLDEQISFMHHYLGGSAERWKAPRVRYRVAHAGWEVADRWTPDMTESIVLACGAGEVALSDADGGRLVPVGDGRDGPASRTVEWVHDPADPVPFMISREWGMLAELSDESALHSRPDVPTFTGEPVGAPLDLLGPAWVELTVDADSPSTHAIARLLDVAPDGAARFVVEGAAVVDCSSGPGRIRVRLGDTAYRMRPGHRLRLAITTSSFPQYLVHPGTDESPLVAVRAQKATQRLQVGGSDGARVGLTVRRRPASGA